MKKGFTLVELLAVIVILAIIALIATPIVLNVINQAQEGADLRSVEGYAKALETAYYADIMVGGNGDINSLTPEYSGATVSCEQKIISNNKLILKNCIVNGSTNLYEYNNGKATKVGTGTSTTLYTTYKTGTTSEVSVIYFNPETNTKCDEKDAVSTTGTKTGCMKWYAIENSDSTKSTVDVILDHNTTINVAYNSDNDNTSMKEIAEALTNDTSTWESTLNARLITAGEIATITGNTEFDEDTTTSSGWFYLDNNSQKLTATSQGASKYSWLFDHTYSCTSYGCNFNPSGDIDHWTMDIGYWTSTPVADSKNYVWEVCRNGGLHSDLADNSEYLIGLRPVITISKSNL